MIIFVFLKFSHVITFNNVFATLVTFKIILPLPPPLPPPLRRIPVPLQGGLLAMTRRMVVLEFRKPSTGGERGLNDDGCHLGPRYVSFYHIFVSN
jgi:hypothetical protein